MEIRNNLPLQTDTTLSQKSNLQKIDQLEHGDSVELSGKTSQQQKLSSVNIAKEKRGAKGSVFSQIARYVAGISNALMSGGSTGAALVAVTHEQLLEKLQNLESKGFAFTQRKSSWLPFASDKRKPITAAQIADTLESGTSEQRRALEVKGEKMVYLPLRSTDDALELDAFQQSLSFSSLPQGDLAKLINDMSGLKYTFKAQGDEGISKVGTYGAYNILTGDWKEKAPFKGEVYVESGGVTMATLTEEKAKDPMKIREELKEAKDAVAELAKLGKGITSSEIKLVGKPVSGTTFAERAKFFLEINKKPGDLEDAKNTYRLVLQSSKDSRTFEESSKTVLRLFDDLDTHANPREVQWSFNYIQQNMKDKSGLKESFHRILKATGELDSTIQGLEFIQTPVGKEDLKTRESIFVGLVEKERENDEAITDYQTLLLNVKPGETVEHASKELFDLMDGLVQRHQNPRNARRGFVYLRQNLKDQPDRQDTFRSLFRELGDIRETIGIMEFLKNPVGSDDPAIREKVFIKILHNEKDTGSAKDDFQLIGRTVEKGESFEAAADLFAGLLDDLKDAYYQNSEAGKAFTHIRKNYRNDPEAIGHIRNLLKKSRDIEHSARAYEELKTPVEKEDFDTREAAYLKIMEVISDSDSALECYKGVTGKMRPGESLISASENFATLTKAFYPNYSYSPQYLKDKDSPLTIYRETKDLFNNNAEGFQAFVDFAHYMKAYKETKEAYELVEKPVKEEAFSERKEVFIDLLKESAPKKKNSYRDDEIESAKSATEGYRALSTKLDKNETLVEGAKRFKLLLSVLSGKMKDATDAFTFISDEMGRGSFPGKTAQEVTEELMKILLITDSLEMAKSQLLHPTSDNKIIEEEDDFVIIGGVKLPVKKGAGGEE